MQIIMHTLYTSLVLIRLVSFYETWNFQIRLIGEGKDVQMSVSKIGIIRGMGLAKILNWYLRCKYVFLLTNTTNASDTFGRGH